MKPNIIFVLLDGSRWDRLNESPNFVKLQQNGTILNNITTAAPYTFASVNAIFTGLYGKDNGVNAYYKMFRLKDSVEFLPEILQKNGYFTSCDLISDKVISKRGFDIYQSHNEYEDDLQLKHPQLLKESFEKANGNPIFSFLQFSRIHTVTVSEVLKHFEWDDPNYYAQKDANMKTYDDVFNEASNYAQSIINTINELNHQDDTILVFFADHGTGVGERFGERNYGVFVYEETIRTFYLFIGPGIKKNSIISKHFSTIDILPTILDLCSTNSISTLPGKSLEKLLTNNQDVEERSYTFSETGGLQGPFPSPKEPNVFCVKTSSHKLIYYKNIEKWELYDLLNDPLEKNNLIEKEIHIVKKLKKELLDWIS